MQRMLALPVEQSDENAAAKSEASAPRQVGLAPVPPAQVAVAPPPVGGKPAQFVVGRETLPNKAAVDKKPALAQGEFSQPEAAPTYLPIGAEPLLPILLNRSKPGPAKPAVAVLPSAGIASKAAQAEALPKPRPAWLKPQPTALAPTAPAQYGPIARLFLVVNRIFDGCTYLLGGAGHWLRGEQGRAAAWLQRPRDDHCGLGLGRVSVPRLKPKRHSLYNKQRELLAGLPTRPDRLEIDPTRALHGRHRPS